MTLHIMSNIFLSVVGIYIASCVLSLLIANKHNLIALLKTGLVFAAVFITLYFPITIFIAIAGLLLFTAFHVLVSSVKLAKAKR